MVGTLPEPTTASRAVPDAEAAFARGDYTRAAYDAESDELRGAALVMLGHHEAGLPLLEGCRTPRARLLSAFGLWSVGEHRQALSALRDVPTSAGESAAARRLEQLVRRPRIRVLLQGRDDPNCPDYDLVGAFRAVPQADVRTIGFPTSSDVLADHWTTYAEVREKLPDGWTPDFYLNHLVEDNPPPVGIEDADFPTFCHTQDYDRHYQHCRNWLNLFDAVVTLGSVDHADMQRLTNAQVMVFPKLLGISAGAPRFRQSARPIDVFVSGSLFNLTRAKAEHLLDVSQLPDQYHVQMLDGYTTTDTYYRRLAESKATYTFVHRWGLINGRALEAISQGTCAVYQAGGELGLFLSEEDGAVPYHPDNGIDVLRRVVDQWETRYRQYGENGSQKVRSVFHFETGIRRYFHFLAFCTALGIQKPRRTWTPVTQQLRYPNRSPGRTLFHFDHSTVRLAQLQERFRAGLPDDTSYEVLDARGESLVYSSLLERTHPVSEAEVAGTAHASHPSRDVISRAVQKLRRNSLWIRRLGGPDRVRSFLQKLIARPTPAAASADPTRAQRLLQSAVDVYSQLAALFPQRIAAAFNLGRLLYEQGDSTSAGRVFETLLAEPDLQFEPGDLLFWREIHDEWLDYESLGQELVQFDFTRDRRPLDRVVFLLRRSALLYAATLRKNAGEIEAARQLLEQHQELRADCPALWMLAARLEPDADRSQTCVREALRLNRTLVAALGASELESLCRVEDSAFADIWRARCRLDARRAS